MRARKIPRRGSDLSEQARRYQRLDSEEDTQKNLGARSAENESWGSEHPGEGGCKFGSGSLPFQFQLCAPGVECINVEHPPLHVDFVLSSSEIG